MASKTASIPRFLLPQYGAIWRTTPRTAPFSRPVNHELGQMLVRYASKTVAAPKAVAAKSTATASKTAAAKKVEAPKAASTKAAASKATSVKASTKVAPPKSAPTKAATTKVPATKAATPKTPTSQAATKAPIAATAKTTLPKSLIPDPSKPIVLEKPEKFNPPSHGARLPRGTPRHYGGAPTFEEVQAQKTKEYPGLPPPPNTWSHWFIHNRHIHMFITLGTLLSLAAYTFAAKFNATSPYAHMIPPISEFASHPIDYIGMCFHVLKLHEEHISAVTAEKRRRRVDDVAKRNEYRKAHGLGSAQGIESWTGSSESNPADSAAPVDDATVSATAPAVVEAHAEPEVQTELNGSSEGQRKKFLGLF